MSAMFDVVDAYCHCGLTKYRPIGDVKRVMERFDVSRKVLVQHLGEYDNTYIQNIVAVEPGRFAGVLLVDVDDPTAGDQLDCWAASNAFRGIRLLARSLATHPGIWEQAAGLGLVFVIYDEPTLASYAEQLDTFAVQHPATPLVLSHLGMPDRVEAPGFPSHGKIMSLAARPNVFVQISGMHMFAKPPYDELVPLIAQLVECFGPNRLVYGSNYPVMKDDAVYEAEQDLVRTGRLGIPLEAVEQVMGGTARQLWFD